MTSELASLRTFLKSTPDPWDDITCYNCSGELFLTWDDDAIYGGRIVTGATQAAYCLEPECEHYCRCDAPMLAPGKIAELNADEN